MQILILLIKEITQGLRDFKSMLLMIIMPTILTVILGIALNDNNKTLINFSNVTVFYNNYLCTKEEKEISKKYLELLDDLKIKNIYTEDKYKEETNTIYIEFNGISNINIKYNKNLKKEAEYILEVFKKINIEKRLMENIKEYSLEMNNKNESFVALEPITGKRTSISLDYYGITMVVLTIMFSAVTGAYKVIRERKAGTLDKMLTLPLSKIKILWGYALGSIAVIFIQILLTLFISIKLLKVNWGNNISIVILVLLSQGIFAISLGIFIGTLVKDNKSAWMILLSIIMISGFFGGAFIPLGSMKSKIVEAIARINLIKYENIAIFNTIYEKNFSLAINLSIIYLILSMILIFITSSSMEERK